MKITPIYVLALALFSSSCMSNGESGSNEQQVQTLKIEATAQSVSLVGLEVHPTKPNGVRFILRAKDPFPVGAKDPVLIVGERVFRDYEYGEQGQVLVFNISEKEISQSGEVYFGWASGDEILEKVSTGQGFERGTRSLIGVK